MPSRMRLCQKLNFDTAPFRCVRMGNMQGAEVETEGAYPTYATEVEYR